MSIALLLSLVFFTGCDKIPNSVVANASFREQEMNPFLTITSPGDYFDHLNMDTLLFAGTAVCTVRINGVTDSLGSDSLYLRIIPLQDTLISRNDSIYGLAEFRISEITGLIESLNLIRPETGLLPSRLFREYVGKSVLNQLEACVSGAEQYATGHVDSTGLFADSGSACAGTEVIKKGILEGFTRMKEDLDFVKKYKSDMESFRNTPPLENINSEFIGLRLNGIYADDSGTVKKGPLSRHEEEKIKWFNISLIVNEIFRGVFSKNTQCFRVLSRKYQRGPDLARIGSEEIIRYFYATDSALFQYWYRDFEGFHALSDTLVMPYQPESEESWQVTPLFWTPFKPIPDRKTLASLLLPGQGKITRLKYLTNVNSYDFSMNNSYVLHGNANMNNKPLRISGFLSVSNGYRYQLSYDRTHRKSLIHIDYQWRDGTSKTYFYSQNLDLFTP